MSVATIINTNEIKMPDTGKSWNFDTTVDYDKPYKISGTVNIDLSSCTSRDTQFIIYLKNAKSEYAQTGRAGFVLHGTSVSPQGSKVNNPITFGSDTYPITGPTTISISLIMGKDELMIPIINNLSLTSQPLVSSKSANIPVPVNIVTKSGNVPVNVGTSEHNYMPNILITLFFLIILFLFFYLKKNKMSGFGYRK